MYDKERLYPRDGIWKLAGNFVSCPKQLVLVYKYDDFNVFIYYSPITDVFYIEDETNTLIAIRKTLKGAMRVTYRFFGMEV